MKQNNKVSYLPAWISIFLVLALGSCIMEYPGVADIPVAEETDLKLSFSYEGNIADNKVLDYKIFVFDHNNTFVGFWDGQNIVDFSRRVLIDMKLNPGIYHFIGWLNNKSLSLYPQKPIPGVTRLGEFRLDLNMENNVVENDNFPTSAPLFYGEIPEIHLFKNVPIEPSLSLKQLSYRIGVRVAGLDNSDLYELEIEDRIQGLDFKGIPIYGQKMFYRTSLSPITYNVSEIAGFVPALLLSKDRKDQILRIWNKKSNKLVYERNLIDLILEQDNKIDFFKVHTLNLSLIFDNKGNVSIKLEVKDWDEIKDNGGLHG
ncbi:hypothetical protein CMT37_18485 [Elizabethkingia anophelis]|nr:hypothetical protein [Elizabethkingia anophelis]